MQTGQLCPECPPLRQVECLAEGQDPCNAAGAGTLSGPLHPLQLSQGSGAGGGGTPPEVASSQLGGSVVPAATARRRLRQSVAGKPGPKVWFAAVNAGTTLQVVVGTIAGELGREAGMCVGVEVKGGGGGQRRAAAGRGEEGGGGAERGPVLLGILSRRCFCQHCLSPPTPPSPVRTAGANLYRVIGRVPLANATNGAVDIVKDGLGEPAGLPVGSRVRWGWARVAAACQARWLRATRSSLCAAAAQVHSVRRVAAA